MSKWIEGGKTRSVGGGGSTGNARIEDLPVRLIDVAEKPVAILATSLNVPC